MTFSTAKGTKYIQENLYFGIIIFSCLSSTKPCFRFLLNCFLRDIRKAFFSVPRKCDCFQGHKEHFPKYLS